MSGAKVDTLIGGEDGSPVNTSIKKKNKKLRVHFAPEVPNPEETPVKPAPAVDPQAASTLFEMIQLVNNEANAKQAQSAVTTPPPAPEPAPAPIAPPVTLESPAPANIPASAETYEEIHLDPVSEEDVRKIDTLRLLTNEYLKHLKQYNAQNMSEEEAKLFKTKLVQVERLESVLSGNMHNFLLTQFNIILENAHKALKTHRTPDWVRYVKNCVIVLGIIATGILPYLIYTYTTNKSLLFFTKTEGKKFYDDAHEISKDYVSLPAVDPVGA